MGIQPLKGKGTSLSSQGVARGLREKMSVLGQGAFLPVWAEQLGLLSLLRNDLNPLHLYLTFHRTAISNLSPVQHTAGIPP